MTDNLEEAVNRVIGAGERVSEARLAEPHAHSDDELDYSYDLLALAARELTRAVEALPKNRKPVGW